MERLLILSNVHVEPNSSAAGRRMLQLIRLFLEKGFEVTYATTFGKSEFAIDLRSLGVDTADVQVNDSSFDPWVKQLDPTIVLFDRFMVEEQFGWRVRQQCPEAVRILDTEDLHCLRYARQAALEAGKEFHDDDLVRDIAFREVASILRSDLSLMISSVEMAILQRVFGVGDRLLQYLPFLEDDVNADDWISFHDRKHFVTIGNFMHAPNFDGVLFLKQAIWPRIRESLPEAELHVYGAYANQRVKELHDPKHGLIIQGRAENASEVVGKARVLLAPLRFGAGLKGKFIDAMHVGTPIITTSIGAEGMSVDGSWSGFVEDDEARIVRAAVSLYQNEEEWNRAQELGGSILRKNFDRNAHSLLFWNRWKHLRAELDGHRKRNFMGQMLWHHSLRSTEFMSKWIEAKNKKINP